MTAAPLDTVLRLHPGRALPAISGGRVECLPQITHGRPAHALPALLGSLFTLCASTHRLAARLAVAAAQGQPAAATPADRRALQLSQAREQILRITLDWPRQLPGVPAGAGPALLLRACPLWRNDLDTESQLQALPAWLEHKWLGQDPAAWLKQHQADPQHWAAQWCQAATGPVAAALSRECAPAQALHTPAAALVLLDDPAQTMPMLAACMADEPGFCLQPSWDGRLRDTGPWSRTNDPARVPAVTAWHRLLARVADALHLAAPEGDRWLAVGSLSTGPGEGVAWVEMARGLLVHRVQLDGRGDAARVAACQVLAPTEWNFHPRGLLAQALSGLQGAGAADAACRLAVAFDPCVRFEIESHVAEAAHA